MGENFGFAASGSGQDKKGSFVIGYGSLLLGV